MTQNWFKVCHFSGFICYPHIHTTYIKKNTEIQLNLPLADTVGTRGTHLLTGGAYLLEVERKKCTRGHTMFQKMYLEVNRTEEVHVLYILTRVLS